MWGMIGCGGYELPNKLEKKIQDRHTGISLQRDPRRPPEALGAN